MVGMPRRGIRGGFGETALPKFPPRRINFIKKDGRKCKEKLIWHNIDSFK